jgi:hypothetical protein
MRTAHIHYSCVTIIFVLAVCSQCFAQVATGTPPFGSFDGGPDIINLGNLNVHLTIPILNKLGRGQNFVYDLGYDTSVWYPSSVNGTETWTPVYNWGWFSETQANTGFLTSDTSSTVCSYIKEGNLEIPNGWRVVSDNFIYYDPFGSPHPFQGNTIIVSSTCSGTSTYIDSVASDGSGYTLDKGALT